MMSYKILVREFLSEYTKVLRKSRSLTQEEMAERLRITSRAYGDLERGKYCFSAVALLFLLLMLQSDELEAFWAGFRRKVYLFEEQEPIWETHSAKDAHPAAPAHPGQSSQEAPQQCPLSRTMPG